MEYLNIALAKGRLAELSMEFFESIGITSQEFYDQKRKLIVYDDKNKIRFFLVKPSDIPTYVEYGAADIGICGKDTLLEADKNLYEVLNLNVGNCKVCVAGLPETKDKMDKIYNKRVATKYPKIAQNYFSHIKKERVEIIKLNGSVELAPLVGLSDVIVDIVESGSTLKANGLVVFEDIVDISARMIVNKVSMKMKNQVITDIITKFRDEVLKRQKI